MLELQNMLFTFSAPAHVSLFKINGNFNCMFHCLKSMGILIVQYKETKNKLKN